MRKYSIAIMTIIVLGVCLLCIFPSTKLDYYGSKDLLMRWCLLLFSGVFLFKDKWLKAYFIWLMICLVTKDSIISGNRMYVLFFGLLFYQILCDRLDSCNINIILNFIAVLALIHVSFIVMQKFGIKQNIYEVLPEYAVDQFPGIASDTNTGGSYLAMFCPAFIGRNKWWYIGLIPLMYGLFLSASLGGSIATCTGLIIFIFYGFNSVYLKSSLIIIIFVIFSFYMVKKESYHLVTDIKMQPRSINFLRVWKQINHKVWGNPIKGYGLGSFKYIWQTMEKNIYKNNTNKCIKRVHNDPLEIAYNQGFVGLYLGLVIIFTSIIKFIRKKPMSSLGLIGFVGVMIAITNSMVHFLISTPAILVVLVYMAVMNNQTQEEGHGKRV